MSYEEWNVSSKQERNQAIKVKLLKPNWSGIVKMIRYFLLLSLGA